MNKNAEEHAMKQAGIELIRRAASRILPYRFPHGYSHPVCKISG